MELIRTSNFLRRVLFADAATCITCGLLMMLGFNQLEQFLGLPALLSRYAGISLLPFAAFLGYLATQDKLSQSAVWVVIILNVLWTVGSFLLLLSGSIQPTTAGYVFVAFQAIGVVMFAILEYFGLKKSSPQAA